MFFKLWVYLRTLVTSEWMYGKSSWNPIIRQALLDTDLVGQNYGRLASQETKLGDKDSIVILVLVYSGDTQMLLKLVGNKGLWSFLICPKT